MVTPPTGLPSLRKVSVTASMLPRLGKAVSESGLLVVGKKNTCYLENSLRNSLWMTSRKNIFYDGTEKLRALTQYYQNKTTTMQ